MCFVRITNNFIDKELNKNVFIMLKEVYSNKIYHGNKYALNLLMINALIDEKHIDKSFDDFFENGYKATIYKTPFKGLLKIEKTSVDKQVWNKYINNETKIISNNKNVIYSLIPSIVFIILFILNYHFNIFDILYNYFR